MGKRQQGSKNYSTTRLNVATQQTFFKSWPIRISFPSFIKKQKPQIFINLLLLYLPVCTLQGGMIVSQIRVS